MGSALPTILVVGVLAFGGYLLINPELRCQVLNLCGTAAKGAAPEDEEDDNEPAAVEDNDPTVVNIYQPPAAQTTVYQPVYYPVRAPRYYPSSNTAVHDCCDCRMINGRAKCSDHGDGNYNISYQSARYDVKEAARLCAKNKCAQTRPPKPPSACPVQISKYGRTYYLTNLSTLPIQTAISPPNYIKSGNCIYQLLHSGGGGGNTTPTPPPPPNTTKCNEYLCKAYPFLCPKCIHPTPAAASGYVRSMYSRIAI